MYSTKSPMARSRHSSVGRFSSNNGTGRYNRRVAAFQLASRSGFKYTIICMWIIGIIITCCQISYTVSHYYQYKSTLVTRGNGLQNTLISANLFSCPDSLYILLNRIFCDQFRPCGTRKKQQQPISHFSENVMWQYSLNVTYTVKN